MNTSGRLLLGDHATKIFLRAMGIKYNPLHDLDNFLKACEQANPRYKGGKDLVRFQLEADEATWPEEIVDATMNLAGHIGMCRGETPLTGAHDIIIALGGARRSPLHRACYAAQAIIDNRASTNLIAVAGSNRQLAESEKTVVQDFAPNAETEYDLCVGAMKKLQSRYPQLTVVAICKDDPKSGNDGVIDETMLQFGSRNGMSIAIVTTRIYAVGLHLDMARAAKRHSWGNFLAAGHSSDPEMVFNRTISVYLSECLTTVRKAAIAASEGC